MKSAIAGARWRAPNVIDDVSRSVPRGRIVAAPADSSASSRSASSCTQRSWNARPLSVSDSLRVVRFSNRALRCASSSETCRDTDDTDVFEALRGAGEAAGLDDLGKGGEREESVHRTLLLHILQ